MELSVRRARRGFWCDGRRRGGIPEGERGDSAREHEVEVSWVGGGIFRFPFAVMARAAHLGSVVFVAATKLVEVSELSVKTSGEKQRGVLLVFSSEHALAESGELGVRVIAEGLSIVGLPNGRVILVEE